MCEKGLFTVREKKFTYEEKLRVEIFSNAAKTLFAQIHKIFPTVLVLKANKLKL